MGRRAGAVPARRGWRADDPPHPSRLTLINGVLDLARIEAGKVELYLDTVGLAALLRTVTEIIRVSAQEKALDFLEKLPLDAPTPVR